VASLLSQQEITAVTIFMRYGRGKEEAAQKEKSTVTTTTTTSEEEKEGRKVPWNMQCRGSRPPNDDGSFLKGKRERQTWVPNSDNNTEKEKEPFLFGVPSIE
jgi:hypothetical protein